MNLLYDAQMPGQNYTYRAYRHKWVGKPCYPPSIAIQAYENKTFVYASWNGSTETYAWKLLAGASPDKLHGVKCVPRSGFETILETDKKGPFFQVEALNCNGKVIGQSHILYRR